MIFGHHYAARCYARDYLERITDEDPYLKYAIAEYKKVANCLKPIWDNFSHEPILDIETLVAIAQHIRDAKKAEEKGIGFIRSCIQSRS